MLRRTNLNVIENKFTTKGVAVGNKEDVEDTPPNKPKGTPTKKLEKPVEGKVKPPKNKPVEEFEEPPYEEPPYEEYPEEEEYPKEGYDNNVKYLNEIELTGNTIEENLELIVENLNIIVRAYNELLELVNLHESDIVSIYEQLGNIQYPVSGGNNVVIKYVENYYGADNYQYLLEDNNYEEKLEQE